MGPGYVPAPLHRCSRPQRPQYPLQVLRPRRDKGDPRTGAGMAEGDHGGVQGQPGNLHTLGLAPAVQGVAQHRVALGGKVYPNLVGATRTQLGFHQGHGAEPDQRAHQGQGVPAAGTGRQRRAQGARPGTADGPVQHQFALDITGHQGTVAPSDGVSTKLALQVTGGQGGAGQHHNAGGVLVDTVDHQRRDRSLRALGQGGCGPGQGRVRLLVDRGVDQHPGRFVGDQDVGIQVQQRERGNPELVAQAWAVRAMLHHCRDRNQRPRIGDDGAVHQGMADCHLTPGTGIGTTHAILDDAGEAAAGGVVGHEGRVQQFQERPETPTLALMMQAVP